MIKSTTLVALTLALAGPALSQTAGVPDVAKVEKGIYGVEPSHARVRFSVNHFGFTTYSGDFNTTSGMLDLDPAKPADSRLSVTVSTGSVYAPSEKLTSELKSADWLDAAKFPDMTFKSTKIEKTSETTATVMGDLTLHGVTKPVTLDATFFGAGPNPFNKKLTIGFEVTGKIKRSDFGVTKYVPLIGDKVDLMISAPFEKQS